MNVDFKIGKHVGMVVTDLKEPDLTEGMSDEELFSVINHSDLESEKITAPRYSYWQSVFRVFFRKKINAFCERRNNEFIILREKAS